MANKVDLDQMLYAVSELSLHCLLRSVCPSETYAKYSMVCNNGIVLFSISAAYSTVLMWFSFLGNNN